MAVLGRCPVPAEPMLVIPNPEKNTTVEKSESENVNETPGHPPLLAAEPQTLQAPEAAKKGQDGKDGHPRPNRSPWLVVLGAVCLTMPTFGVMSAFGLFQVYWEAHQLASPDDDDASISWIGSLLGFLNCLFGLASGVLLDRYASTRGLVWQLVPSSVVYWASFLALAWCGTYGAFLACMVVAGISSALPSTARFVVVDRVFATTNRPHSALATGIVSTGAPLGGLMVSLMLRALLARTDTHAWVVAMVWLSSVIGVLELVGCVLVVWGARDGRGGRGEGDRQGEGVTIEGTGGEAVEVADHSKTQGDGQDHNHLGRKCVQPQSGPPRQPVGDATVAAETPHKARLAAAAKHLGHFKDRGFLLFTLCVFVYEFVLYIQWGSLPYYAARTGLGDVFYLQMVYNIGALPGRTVPSWLAARFGPFTVTLAMTALTILTVFVVWVPFGGHSAAALYLVAFLMGVGTGSFTPLVATCLSRLCNGRGFGTWLGTAYAFASVASLIGNPINQALIDATGPRFSVVFQGLLLSMSFVLCVVVRRIDIRQRQTPSALSALNDVGA